MPEVRFDPPELLGRDDSFTHRFRKPYRYGDHLPEGAAAIAQSLIDQGHFNIAIVTCHMACEVAAERGFDAAYAAKELETLGEAIDGLMNGHNLGNEKHRKLYNALTGTELEKQPFWPRFKNASEKRNSIVHKGERATRRLRTPCMRPTT